MGVVDLVAVTVAVAVFPVSNFATSKTAAAAAAAAATQKN